MATYKKNEFLGGKWVKGSEVISGTRCRLTTETNPQESQFKDKEGNVKKQDVSKVRFEGSTEDLNISLNRATINGLVDAFGEDSKNWISKILLAITEKIRVGGRAQTALYLVAEGYEKQDDENGFAVIVKKGTTANSTEEISPEDLPF